MGGYDKLEYTHRWNWKCDQETIRFNMAFDYMPEKFGWAAIRAGSQPDRQERLWSLDYCQRMVCSWGGQIEDLNFDNICVYYV